MGVQIADASIIRSPTPSTANLDSHANPYAKAREFPHLDGSEHGMRVHIAKSMVLIRGCTCGCVLSASANMAMWSPMHKTRTRLWRSMMGIVWGRRYRFLVWCFLFGIKLFAHGHSPVCFTLGQFLAMPSFQLAIITAIVLSFTLLYTICSLSARDPTSIFFDASKAYTPRYSALRSQQAKAHVSTYNSTFSPEYVTEKHIGKKLCVGIPSVARQGPQYLPGAVGSLLNGLTAHEREEIYLMVFIPHSDPATHPAYGEPWLSKLTDRILTYEELNTQDMNHVRTMETKGGMFEEKGLYDYSYILSKCAERNTPYIVILEDDVIAMDGWYHRTVNALQDAEEQSTQREKPFLYLRLFYTEAFLGWNSEDWKTYLFYSLCFAAMPAAVVSFLRATSLPGLLNKHTWPTEARTGYRRLVLTFYALMAAAILLLFALRRMTVLPLPTGVHAMPRFGCCSQAFVFPRQKALDLISYFAQTKTGYVDVLTERYADTRGELRYAVTPSVFQHVGTTSSKMGEYGPIFKQKTWSFGFEE